MRLGFVSARFAARSGGRLLTDAGVGRLLDALATHVPLTVSMSLVEEAHALLDHEIDPKYPFVPLPAMPTFARGVFQHRAAALALREMEERCDVLVVQLPFSAPTALLALRRPTVFHVCADVASLMQTSTRYRGVKRMLALSAASTVEGIHQAITRRRHVRLVANGQALRERYRHAPGRAVVSTALLDRDVDSVKRTRPMDAPFRVLFVGYLRTEKGVDVLMDAFEALLTRIPNAELHVVGPELADQPEISGGLRTRLASWIDEGRVRMLGPIGYGHELFRHYADADVLVLPSRSEGTPRVLVEARAFGCPVIASRVGGIPTSVHDDVDGLLVPSGDAPALTAALLRVALEDGVRTRLVRAGHDRARSLTVERFADAMLEEARVLLAK